jgi:hypothetical protein
MVAEEERFHLDCRTIKVFSLMKSFKPGQAKLSELCLENVV